MEIIISCPNRQAKVPVIFMVQGCLGTNGSVLINTEEIIRISKSSETGGISMGAGQLIRQSPLVGKIALDPLVIIPLHHSPNHHHFPHRPFGNVGSSMTMRKNESSTNIRWSRSWSGQHRVTVSIQYLISCGHGKLKTNH